MVLLVIENGQSAVVISRTDGNPPPALKVTPGDGTGVRYVSIIPGSDKHHQKRDNLLEPEPPVAPEEDSNGHKRRTFTKNQLRPCTFCKFFTTITPSPKPKMYLNVVRY
uniref:Uncharacterized protein n=1 Tax=Anopheles epiroticus TaxID=199890 RepID=A0A182PDW2_9DIPT